MFHCSIPPSEVVSILGYTVTPSHPPLPVPVPFSYHLTSGYVKKLNNLNEGFQRFYSLCIVMDQILRGIVASDHPENVKRSLIQQLVSKAGGNVADDQNRALFEIGTEWMIKDGSVFLNDSGKLVLTTWAKRQKDVFQKYFTEGYLLSFLAEREKMSLNCAEYLRTCFDLMQHNSQIFSLYTAVRHRAHIWVEKNSDIDFCAVVARLLIEYDHCWPVGENLLQCNLSLIKALSRTELPKTSKEEMKACLQNCAIIAALLNKMWVKNQALLFPVLTEIFKIISNVGPNPSVAVASVVQYFSTDIIDTATSLAASNPSVSDENLSLSLCRMINWLSWPGVKKVDQWIIGFLKALASAKKHSILISVTLKEVAQVWATWLIRFTVTLFQNQMFAIQIVPFYSQIIPQFKCITLYEMHFFGLLA